MCDATHSVACACVVYIEWLTWTHICSSHEWSDTCDEDSRCIPGPLNRSDTRSDRSSSARAGDQTSGVATGLDRVTADWPTRRTYTPAEIGQRLRWHHE